MLSGIFFSSIVDTVVMIVPDTDDLGTLILHFIVIWVFGLCLIVLIFDVVHAFPVIGEKYAI